MKVLPILGQDLTRQLEPEMARKSDDKTGLSDHVRTDHGPVSIGSVLANSNRLALLGLPGAGKSTIIKRLATALRFPKGKRWLTMTFRVEAGCQSLYAAGSWAH